MFALSHKLVEKSSKTMRRARSCNFSSLLLFFLPQKIQASGQYEKLLWRKLLYTDNRLSIFGYFANLLRRINFPRGTITYVSNVRFNVQAAVQCYTKDFNLVSRIQNAVVDRKGNGHPAVPAQHYTLKFIRVGHHVLFMKPCNRSVGVIHKIDF